MAARRNRKRPRQVEVEVAEPLQRVDNGLWHHRRLFGYLSPLALLAIMAPRCHLRSQAWPDKAAGNYESSGPGSWMGQIVEVSKIAL